MARRESRTQVAIWSDEDFVTLPAATQRLYWLLFSQPQITLLGVLALTPGRWAKLAPDTTVESIRDSLAELEQKRFIVVDVDHEELLVRSFLRHDGVWRNEKTRSAAMGQRALVSSPKILAAVQAEIDRAANGKDLVDSPSDTPPDSPSDDLGDASRTCAHAVSSLLSPVTSHLSPSPVPTGADKSSPGLTRVGDHPAFLEYAKSLGAS